MSRPRIYEDGSRTHNEGTKPVSKVVYVNNIDQSQGKVVDNSSHTTNINHHYHPLQAHDELQDLRPADRSRVEPPRFLKGTRQRVLQNIYSWFNNNGDKNILWLAGSPGAGKSAIAHVVWNDLTKKGHLVSCFPFKSGSASLGDPANFWRTVAYDVAKHNHAYRQAVIPFIPSIATLSDVDTQFETLIEGILHSSGIGNVAIVVILDALDEAGEPRDRRVLLSTIRKWSRLPRSFKLLITSRIQSDIEKELLPISQHLVLATGRQVDHEASTDVRTFLESEFELLRTSTNPSWPGPDIIDGLVVKAAGLFIWADTVMRFLHEGRPEDQLEIILTGTDEPGIPVLYERILDSIFKKQSQKIVHAFQEVVGFLLLAKLPPTPSLISHIANVSQTDVDDLLSMLRTVIIFHSDGSVQTRHQSFVDFLMDPNLKGKAQFFIDGQERSREVFKQCLTIMNSSHDGLRFNICNLPSSSHLDRDIIDLRMRIESNVSPQLHYAACFWSNHLQELSRVDGGLQRLAQCFLYDKLLYWFELLSLCGKIPVASRSLAILWLKLKDIGEAKTLAAFTADARRFLAHFHQPIAESAPHIYLSALPFAPINSEVSKHYLAKFPYLMSVKGHWENWSSLICVFKGHQGRAMSIAISPDGRYIASGGEDCTVRIWDIELEELAFGPFHGHTGAITTVAFSPDSFTVASGSDNGVVCVWDFHRGHMIFGPFQDAPKHPDHLIFSPDGLFLAAKSRKHLNPPLLWNLAARKSVLGRFREYSATAIAFSHDSKYFVVESKADRPYQISVWNIKNGDLAFGPFSSRPYGPYQDQLNGTARLGKMQVFPNGTVEICYDDGELRAWNMWKGKAINEPPFILRQCPSGGQTVSHYPGSDFAILDTDTLVVRRASTNESIFVLPSREDWMRFEISPTGKRIVWTFPPDEIRIFDLEGGRHGQSHANTSTTGAFIHPVLGLDPTFVVISRDNKLVATSNRAQDAVVVLNICTGSHRSFTHFQPIAADFSPDGRLLVAAGPLSLCIWDLQKASTTFTRQLLPWQSPRLIRFTDGRLLISTNNDGSFHLWNTRMQEENFRNPVDSGRLLANPSWISPDGRCLLAHQSMERDPDSWFFHRRMRDVGPPALRLLEVDTRPKKPSLVMMQGPKFVAKEDEYLRSIVAIFPGGKQLVYATDRMIQVWRIESGRWINVIKSEESEKIVALAPHPNGRFLGIGCWTRRIIIRNIEAPGTSISVQGQDQRTAARPVVDVLNKSPVRPRLAIEFSPDGRFLVSGDCGFGTLQLWDIHQLWKSANAPGSIPYFHNTAKTLRNGWIATEGTNELLFWVPDRLRDALLWPGNTQTFGTTYPPFRINFDTHRSWAQWAVRNE